MSLITIAGFVFAAVVLLPLIALLAQVIFLQPRAAATDSPKRSEHRAGQPGAARSRTATANW